MKPARNAVLWLAITVNLLLIWLLLFGENQVQAGQRSLVPDREETTGLQPRVVISSRYDTSSPLRTASLPQPDGIVGEPVDQHLDFTTVSLPKVHGKKASSQDADLALTPPDQAIIQSMPAPIHNFAGVVNVNKVQPPDTEGEIGYDPVTGTKYYMQWVNLSLAVWDVTNPGNVVLLLGPVNGNSLFTGFGGPCENTNSGDPIILFDHLEHRWLASQFALPNGKAGPYFQCVAVSKSADPTGEWHRYEYKWPVNKFNDYPKLAVWPDAYYLTVNQFINTDAGSLVWGGAGVAALERENMLAGTQARLVFFDLHEVDPNFGGMLPADLDGPLPPSGTPGYFIEWDDSVWLEDANDTIRVWEFKVDWASTASSTFGLDGLPNTLIATTDVDPDMCGYQRNCIPQPGTTNKLDAIADRLMYRAQYRNFGGRQSLVSNHTVDANGVDHAGIHWFELHKSGGNWSLYQDGIYAPDEEHRWMASAALDHVGNLALGYSVSSVSTFPSIRYAGRMASDALGSMPQGEVTLIAGGGSQTSFSNRWGDYSMMSVDPVDDCTFWYTQEYYQTSGSLWQTRIGSFRFPDCFIGPTGVLEGQIADQSTGLPISGAKIIALGTDSRSEVTFSNDQGRYQFILPAGTYNLTVLAYGYDPEQASGVVIVENNTVIRNFSLAAANLHVVQGVVKDGSGKWPLYARLTVRGNPFDPPPPTDDIWTDPVTGNYSVTLAEDITYTFNVSAWVPGYKHLNRTITPLVGDRTENFNLTADPTACTAPSYEPLYAYHEDFEADNGAYAHSGAIDEWAWGAPVAWPNKCVSGSKCWGTDLAGDYENNSSQTLISPIIDLSAYSPPLTVKWWQAWHIESETSDQAFAQVSVNGGPWTTIWRHRGGTTQVDWNQMTYDASPAAGGTIQFRFQLRSDISIRHSGYFVDDIRILDDCTQQSGGLVVGNVYDGNIGAALTGVQVSNDAGEETVTLTTPQDPLVDDGFYTLFSPAGTYTFSAAMTGGFQTDIQSPSVLSGDTIRQDFFLPAARFTGNPKLFNVTLTPGASKIVPLILTNDGDTVGQFLLKERDGGFIPSTDPATNKILLIGENVDEVGWQVYRDSLTAMGTTWDEWNLDILPFPTPADLALYDDLIWFVESILGQSDAEAQVVADWLVSGDKGLFVTSVDFLRTLESGTPGLGKNNLYMLLNAQYVGNYAGASIAYLQGTPGDPLGGDFAPPNSLTTTGTTKNNGDYADKTTGALTGLIYGPGNFGSGHAAMTHHEGSNYRAVWLGVNFHNGLANQNQQHQLMENTITFLDARRDIPWLDQNPTSGALDARGEQAINFLFDAGVPEVEEIGQYKGTLVVENDSPYGPLAIPVTMEVVPDQKYGVQLSPNDTTIGLAGTTVTYTVHITNTGRMKDTFDLSVRGNTWPSHLSRTNLTLDSYSASTFSAAVDIPAGALGHESDMVTITATSRGDNARSDSTILETSAGTTYGVDLSPDGTQTAQPGTTVTYSLFITNTGNVANTFDLTASGNSWTLTLSAPNVTLPAFATATLAVAVDVPSRVVGYEFDLVTIKATSRQDATISDTAILKTTTRSLSHENYTPVILSG